MRSYPTTKIACAYCGSICIDLDYAEDVDGHMGKFIFSCDDCGELSRITLMAVDKEVLTD